MCPHCDPNAWKIEEEIMLQQRFFDSWTYYDDDNRNDSYNDYDCYMDNDSIRPELIQEGSADEFVEAWWQKKDEAIFQSYSQRTVQHNYCSHDDSTLTVPQWYYLFKTYKNY